MKAKLILILTVLTLSVFGVETNSENSSKEEKKSNVNTNLVVGDATATTETKDADTIVTEKEEEAEEETEEVRKERIKALAKTLSEKEESKDDSTATSKETKEEIMRKKRLRYLAYKRSKQLEAKKKQQKAKKKSMSLPKWIKDDGILKYINEDAYVYFVHSYYANSSNEELIAYSNYGQVVPGIVRKNNIYGIQFHPEKSSDVGLNILKAYGEMIK